MAAGEIKTTGKYVWLSTRLVEATNSSSHIDYTDSIIRQVIEPDMKKCRENRQRSQENDLKRYGFLILQDGSESSFTELTRELDLSYNTDKYLLAETFASVISSEVADLSRLHYRFCKDRGQLKDRDEKRELMQPFLDPAKRKPFQEVFLRFVLDYIAPHVHAVTDSKKLYFQAFPCIRIVRPGEFSIGPHCDASYGFSQANINFYVPFTDITGTNSLVLESSPGLEDWHTIEASYGDIKRFYGAQCSHFTTENCTDSTRVSLDFRVIDGRYWIEDHDQFTSSPGYYACCVLDADTGKWVLEGELPEPDWRVGFPFEKKRVAKSADQR
jgi:hypothetical protein